MSPDTVEARWNALRDSIYAWKMGGGLNDLCELWRFGRETGLDAIRIDRVNNASHESYLLVVRHADLGGPAPAVPLDTRKPSKLAARLLQCQGRLWLETLETTQAFGGPSQVDGQPLPPRTLVPLHVGMNCRLAGHEVLVKEWRQPEEIS